MPAELDVYKDWLGIPEGPRPPDHYQLLRLKEFEDSPDKIRANYKKLNAHVRKYATGQYSEKSQELLNELAKAMLCLTDAERKLEYDRSLGREVDEAQVSRRTVENILMDQGHVSRDQVREAENYAEQMGLDLRDAFVQLKMVDPALAAQALAMELGLPYVDLSEVTPEDEVLDRLPRTVVKPNSILPLFIDNDVVLVACANLMGHDLEQELQLRYELPVRPVLSAPKAIEQGIAKYYAPGLRNEPTAPAGKTKGGKAAPQGAAPKAEKRGPQSAEEKAEGLKKNRMYAIIAVCWSVVAAWLIWTFFLPPVLFALPTMALFIGLPALTAAACYVTLWNKTD